VWIGKDKSFKVKTIEKSNGNKVFISTDEGKTPLYVVDGKEMPDYEIGDLDADQIETINVLKGESATEKYGDKAKDGVVEVVTKKKD
jgi:outer membrane receptor for ferrienterochelin and colicin